MEAGGGGGGGGTQVGEVTRLGGVTACPYDLLF